MNDLSGTDKTQPASLATRLQVLDLERQAAKTKDEWERLVAKCLLLLPELAAVVELSEAAAKTYELEGLQASLDALREKLG